MWIRSDERGFVEILAAVIILAISIAASPVLIEVTKHVSEGIVSSNQPTSAYVSVSGGTVSATNPMPVAMDLERIKLTVNGKEVDIKDENGNGMWESFEKISFDLSEVLQEDLVVISLYIDGKEVYRTVYAKPTAFPEDQQYPVINVEDADASGNLEMTVSVSDDTAVAMEKVVAGDQNAEEKDIATTDALEEVAKKHHMKIEDVVEIINKHTHGKSNTEAKEREVLEDLKDFSSKMVISSKDLSGAVYLRILAKDITGKTSSKIIWLKELAPSVVILKPSDGDTFWSGDAVEILARATDAKKVYLYLDDTLILSKNAKSDPYEFGTTVTPSVGEHAIKAVAENAAGQTAVAIKITVKRDNPPAVVITNPKDGDIVAEATVTANITDDRGLSKVRVYFKGNLLTEEAVTGTKYTLEYTLTPPSDGILEVVAEDIAGNTGSDSVSIVRDQPPTVQLFAAATLYTVGSFASARLSANADDDVGVQYVDFYVDGKLECRDYDEPYTCTANVPLGVHSVKAVATDTAGQTAGDSDILIVIKDNPPSVSITQPKNGDTFWTTQGVCTTQIVASASDDIGISLVEFFVDGASIGWVTEPPYSMSASLAVGTHTIKVVATDTSGQTAEDQITVRVVRDNPPSVSITQPKNGDTYLTPSGTVAVSVTATASDDRGISKVDFYVDGSLIDSDASVPYSTTTTLGEGDHTIKAVATDTAGQTAEDRITVHVIKDTPPVLDISMRDGGDGS